LLHEIGHALGLKHPWEAPVLEPAEVYRANTIYGSGPLPPEGIGQFDIASVQYLYGVNPNARTGNDTYHFSDRFIWDGAGIDTLSAAEQTAPLNINMEPGSWIYAGKLSSSILDDSQAFINYGTQLENVVGGSGNDALIGNASANAINGAGGNDSITGGAGNDTIDGGAGVDTAIYYSPKANYTITKTDSGYSIKGKESGIDALIGIESLQFSDQVLILVTGFTDTSETWIA
jgi:serralysin